MRNRDHNVAMRGHGFSVLLPILASATVSANGTTVTLVMSQSVTGHAGFTITPSGGAATLAYASGDPSASLVFTASRTIGIGETITLAYTAGDVVGTTGGLSLANFSGASVTNASTQDITAPTLSSTVVGADGVTVVLTWNETVTFITDSANFAGFIGGSIIGEPDSASLTSGTQITLVFPTTIPAGSAFTISVTEATVRDAATNANAAITQASSTNNSEQIVYDAVSNSGYQAAASTYSWSHTCTGAARLLTVDVSRLSVPGTTVTGITYNGVALTQVGVTSTGTDAGQVSLWRLVAPASGSNTIAVTLSGVCISAACAVSYRGVHQTTPTEAYNGATAVNVGAADATVTVTTLTGNDWVHGAVASTDTAITAGQTSRNNVTGAGGSGANEDTGPKVVAGTQAISYTDVAALATWVIGGYGIRHA